MKFIEVTDKKDYLAEHYPFVGVPSLTDKRKCLHCDKIFTIGDFKVALQYHPFLKKELEFIVCPTAPDCDGTVIDWVQVDF